MLLSVTVITIDERAGSHHLTSGLRSVASDVFAPVRSGVDSIIRPVGNFFAGAFDYGSLEQENAQLRASNGRLRVQASLNAGAERQLRQITALQHLPYVGNLQHVTAQVIEDSPSNYQASLEINAGRDNGVDVGMPVVANGGLVGQVTESAKRTAFVTLVTDTSSRVGAAFPSGDTATIVGQGPGHQLAADFVSSQAAVRNGELLTTNSYQGGEYPAGLPVGRVVSHRLSASSSQQVIRLAPTADLQNLGYVDVVLWISPP